MRMCCLQNRKILFRGNYTIRDLKAEEVAGTFYKKKDCKK